MKYEKNKINKIGQQHRTTGKKPSITYPPHDPATPDHRQEAQQDPNENKTGSTLLHDKNSL
jgi:hypothetical protein